jgi:hypothetical protein
MYLEVITSLRSVEKKSNRDKQKSKKLKKSKRKLKLKKKITKFAERRQEILFS